jgi:hypothetical protein
MTKRLIPAAMRKIGTPPVFAAKTVASLFSLAVTGCKKSLSADKPTPVRSSNVVLKVGVATPGYDGPDSFAVPGGSVVVETAAVNIAEFRIQENSGQDTSDEGQNGGDSAQTGGGDGELPDIVVPGPFLIQTAAGETFIDTVAVYPGTFRKVDATFAASPLPPLTGKSIYITGAYRPESGSSAPFALRSEFHDGAECPIAGNGLVIPRDTTVALVVEFGVAEWFAELDLGSAELTNGVILIDAGHNPGLLEAFEAALSGGNNGGGEGDNDEGGGGEH